MTDSEEIGGLEGKLYVLEAFIKEKMVPRIPRTPGERIPPDVKTFIENMKKRGQKLQGASSSSIPKKFSGLPVQKVSSGMGIGCDFLEGVFT